VIADRPPSSSLCGDFKTPRRELPDGDIGSFAHDSAGRLRAERGERCDGGARSSTDCANPLNGNAPDSATTRRSS
jgi:hypothetical protein